MIKKTTETNIKEKNKIRTKKLRR